jgi:hypothetical protein
VPSSNRKGLPPKSHSTLDFTANINNKPSYNSYSKKPPPVKPPARLSKKKPTRPPPPKAHSTFFAAPPINATKNGKGKPPPPIINMGMEMPAPREGKSQPKKKK